MIPDPNAGLPLEVFSTRNHRKRKSTFGFEVLLRDPERRLSWELVERLHNVRNHGECRNLDRILFVIRQIGTFIFQIMP